MAPPKRPWFRFYTEAIHDRKIRRLDPAARWLWVVVLAVARQSPKPGYLMLNDTHAISEKDLADDAALSRRKVAKELQNFLEIGLLEKDLDLDCFRVVRWNERQYESDDSAGRVAKHREISTGDRPLHSRYSNAPGNNDVTHQIQRQNTETDIPPYPPKRGNWQKPIKKRIDPLDDVAEANKRMSERHDNPCEQCEGSTKVFNDQGEALNCPKCKGTGVAA